MAIVKEVAPDTFVPIGGNPTLTSLDGETLAPLKAVLTLPDDEKAAYGIYVTQPMTIPEGQQRVGTMTFQRIDGVIIEMFDLEDLPGPEGRWQISTYRVTRRIEEAGKTADAMIFFAANPSLQMRFLTVGFIWNDDENGIAAITAMGLDPAEILAADQTFQ